MQLGLSFVYTDLGFRCLCRRPSSWASHLPELQDLLVHTVISTRPWCATTTAPHSPNLCFESKGEGVLPAWPLKPCKRLTPTMHGGCRSRCCTDANSYDEIAQPSRQLLNVFFGSFLPRRPLTGMEHPENIQLISG